MYRRIYTTGEAAELLGVCPVTVSRACDAGLLKHWRVPTTMRKKGDRRIAHDDLLAFMAAQNMPAKLVERAYRHGILLANDDSDLSGVRERAGAPWRWSHAADSFEAGVLCGTRKPDALIVDMNCGGAVSGEVIRCLKALCPDVRIAVILGEDGLGGDYSDIVSVVAVRYTWDWLAKFLDS